MKTFVYSNPYSVMPFGRRALYLRDTIVALVGRDFKLRYKRSLLGILWTMVNPLAQLLILTFVFKSILGVGTPNYASFLFTGLLTWNWFSLSLLSATGSVVSNRDLIKCPEFRPALLPIIYVTTYLVHFLLALPILLVMLWIGELPILPVQLALPLVMVVQFMFTLGIAYFVATVHVYFRDMEHLLTLVLNLLFFLTPIFYDWNSIPQEVLSLFRLNPMAHIISAYRSLLLQGKMPDLPTLAVLYVVSLAVLGLGYAVYRSASSRFIEEI